MMDVKRCLLLIVLVVSFGCSDRALDSDGDGWRLGDDAGVDAGETPDRGTPDSVHPDLPDPPPQDVGTPPDDGAADAGEPPPSPVTFKLINGHDRPVFAYRNLVGGPACVSGGWLEVFEEGEPRRLRSDCTRCSCDEEDCVICGLDCAPGADPQYSQLSVGEERTLEWDGLLRVDEHRPDRGTCEVLRPPKSEDLVARFCWGYHFETTLAPFGNIAMEECRDVEFSPDDEVVELTIPPSARPEGVTFVMRNDTDRTLYAHTSIHNWCQSEWLTLSNDGGSRLQIYPGCGPCSCVEVEPDPECARPCANGACAPVELQELAPGELRFGGWNRVAYYPEVDDVGAVCESDLLVTQPVTAEFCWGEAPGDGVGALSCDSVVFEPFAEYQHEIEYLITEP